MSRQIFSDFHIHSMFSGDCEEAPGKQAEAAFLLGMGELCFTDHHDLGSESMCNHNFILDIPAFWDGIQKVKEDWAGKLDVRIGIEMGLMRREAGAIRAAAADRPFDFIIGSSHFLDGIDVYDKQLYEGKTDVQVFRRFFESTLWRVREFDCFDVLGHLDYIVRYAPEKNLHYHPSDYWDLIEEILKSLIERGKGIECNTAGFKYGLSHSHPYEEILRFYKELGGEIITVGSDSHKAEQTGGYFDLAREILLDSGFRYYSIFKERKPQFKKIV